MRHKVLIYKDDGSVGTEALMQALTPYYQAQQMTVQFTNAAEIRSKNALSDEVLALFIPGGRARSFHAKLGDDGNFHIRNYVLNGGMYYGICAGAYYACEQTTFEADLPDLRCLDRYGLNLMPAEAVGTLYREFQISPYTPDARSTIVADIVWASDSQVYAGHYHGGPYFRLSAGLGAQALAYYHLKEAYPAIVMTTYGKGKVVLSGIHFEDTGEQLFRRIQAQQADRESALKVAQALSRVENRRFALLKRMLDLSRIRN